MEPAPPSLLKLAMRAFTLVEMLVVLVIITLITTIALIGQSTFNQSLFLTDTAYSVALSLREMQSFGLSSRKYSGVQNPGYGAYFSSSNLNSYVLFADIDPGDGVPTNCPVGDVGTPDSKPGNCLYDTALSGPLDSIIRTYTFDRGFTITHFCGKSGDTRYCSNAASGGQRITDLNIAFLRSDTETVINGRVSGNWVALTSGEIYIQWPQSDSRRGICVSRIGQVSVTQSDCP